jgi:hypothetical protein
VRLGAGPSDATLARRIAWTSHLRTDNEHTVCLTGHRTEADCLREWQRRGILELKDRRTIIRKREAPRALLESA